MKTVRIENGVVVEIIPDYALPVSQWYGESFAAQCVEAPDEVGQRWQYDSEAGTFSEPNGTIESEPTIEEQLQESIRSQNATITIMASVINDLMSDVEALQA